MVHVVAERLGQVERPGDAVDERHRVNGEARLQGCLLVEVVEHHVGVGVALQADDEPDLPAGRVVLDLGDPVEVTGRTRSPIFFDIVATAVWYGISVTTILSSPSLLDLGDGPQLDRALPVR